jgi:predicted AlkP superfamily pyrophosphatase or phosphodiesterase
MTPAGGDYVTAAALAALDRYGLGLGGPPDLLTLSYSHYDGIGHQFTPASLESIDALLRLDDQLQELMDGLDAHAGAGRWSLVLSADHGAPDGVPDYLDLSAVPAAITAALEAAGLPAPSAFVGAGLFLADGLDPEQRARSVEIARQVATQSRGVEDLIDMANPSGPFADAFRASAWAGRGPDLRLLLAPNAVPASADDHTGTTHGAPRPYDQNVPLLAWGVGVRAGQGETVDARQAAPTVAALLGVPAPSGAELGAVATALR